MHVAFILHLIALQTIRGYVTFHLRASGASLIQVIRAT